LYHNKDFFSHLSDKQTQFFFGEIGSFRADKVIRVSPSPIYLASPISARKRSPGFIPSSFFFNKAPEIINNLLGFL